jgi:hypothetical protein
MELSEYFTIAHNVPDAIRQEIDLARQHYDQVTACRDVFNRSHGERWRDARDRLNKARDLMLQTVRDA